MTASFDTIVIGSGIGGLVAASLLAQSGQRVLVCESHGIPGGAAHSFSRQGFTFDSGPSFYCGLGGGFEGRSSLNPLTQVLERLGETLDTVVYDPLGHYHFPDCSGALGFQGDQTFPVYCKLDRYRAALAQVTPAGAKQFAQFEQRMLKLYGALKDVSVIDVRPDPMGVASLLGKHPLGMLKLLLQLPMVQKSVGQVMDATVSDPWVRRLIDLECFLLSGLNAHGTIAPEVAFMLGERTTTPIDYPIGGSGAIIKALVRGLERFGGTLRLNAHVREIVLGGEQAVGVQLRNGEVILGDRIISNATRWDTFGKLLPERAESTALQNQIDQAKQQAIATPAVESFMHLHLGIRSEGLEHLTGHHVVVHRDDQPVTVPGNTCMISIPSVWDPNLAPEGHHVVHSYTLEPYVGWERDENYASKKKQKAEVLYRALERVIPDVRSRVTVELIGTPLTHARYLRRYQGSYGPAIAAGKGTFPGPKTPIKNLYCVGDSSLPGIGVPAVAASGIFCANMLKN